MLCFLQIGDQILSINDVQLDGMLYDEVVQLLKKLGIIKFTVFYGKESLINRWLNVIVDILFKVYFVGDNFLYQYIILYYIKVLLICTEF